QSGVRADEALLGRAQESDGQGQIGERPDGARRPVRDAPRYRLTDTVARYPPTLSAKKSSLTDRYKRPLSGAVNVRRLPTSTGAPLLIRAINAPAGSLRSGADSARRPA